MENALARAIAGEMTVTCLRFATACGMSDRLRLDLVLNDFVASALATGEITVLSDGTPWRPLIDVADMARAIEWAIGRDTDQGGRVLVVNAGSNAGNYQVRDLAKVVAAELPGTKVSINTAAPPDLRSYQVDFSLFAELAPAHLPAVPLAQSVRNLRAGLSGMGFSDKRVPHFLADAAQDAQGPHCGGPAVCRPPLAVMLEGAHIVKFHPTPLHGAYTIELEKRGDDRGFFARFFCQKEFEAAGVADADRSDQQLAQRESRHAARHALSIARRPPKSRWCAASAAPSMTPSSTCGRTRRPSANGSAPNSPPKTAG